MIVELWRTDLFKNFEVYLTELTNIFKINMIIELWRTGLFKNSSESMTLAERDEKNICVAYLTELTNIQLLL